MSGIVCTSCKLSDKLWGIVCPATNTIHRITFSRDIADFIADTDNSKYTSKPFRFVRGQQLLPGQKSATGLYAIVSTKKDLVLRVSLFLEGAKTMTECDTRHIEEIFLVPIDT